MLSIWEHAYGGILTLSLERAFCAVLEVIAPFSSCTRSPRERTAISYNPLAHDSVHTRDRRERFPR
jgi:hypothetical protein